MNFLSRYKMRDVDDYFRDELILQYEKIFCFPRITNAIIDVAKEINYLRMVIGIGDMFNSPEIGYGNIRRYKNWREKVKDINRKISKPNQQRFEQKKSEVKSYFTERGYNARDYDIIVIIDDGIDERDIRVNLIERFTEEAKKDPYLKKMIEGSDDVRPVFNGIDLYEHCIFNQNRFLTILKNQINSYKAKLEFKPVGKNRQGLRLWSEPELPLTIVEGQPYSHENMIKRGVKGWITKIEVNIEHLSEPLLDVFELNNSATIYKNISDPDLERALNEYKKLKQQPRELEEQLDIFEKSLCEVKQLNLGDEFNKSVDVTLDYSKSLRNKNIITKKL